MSSTHSSTELFVVTQRYVASYPRSGLIHAFDEIFTDREEAERVAELRTERARTSTDSISVMARRSGLITEYRAITLQAHIDEVMDETRREAVEEAMVWKHHRSV